MADWSYLDSLIVKYTKRGGYKAKVIAKCIDCTCDPLAPGTWREQVKNCGVTDCPLYSVRPLPEGEKHEHR